MKMNLSSKRIQLFFVNNLSWFITAIFYAVFAFFNPRGMLNRQTLLFMIHSSVPLGFMVIGESLCLLSGGMDLSLAQMTGFVGMLSALIITDWLPGIPAFLTIFIPIIIGLFAGSLNGALIGFMNLNPFLVTLGTYMSFQAGTLLLKSYPVYSGFPDIYLTFGGGWRFSIPIFIAVIILMSLWLRYSRFGLQIYGVGGDERAVEMLGVKPGKIRFFTFSIAGGFIGLASLFYTGYLKSVPSSMADGEIFLVFAGAIIGGISLKGGRGTMVDALSGLIFLAVVDAGLSMFDVDPFLRRLSYGLLVILAIIINRMRERMRDRLLQPE